MVGIVCVSSAVRQEDVNRMLRTYQEKDLAFGIRVDELQAILGRSREETELLSQVFDNGSGT